MIINNEDCARYLKLYSDGITKNFSKLSIHSDIKQIFNTFYLPVKFLGQGPTRNSPSKIVM